MRFLVHRRLRHKPCNSLHLLVFPDHPVCWNWRNITWILGPLPCPPTNRNIRKYLKIQRKKLWLFLLTNEAFQQKELELTKALSHLHLRIQTRDLAKCRNNISFVACVFWAYRASTPPEGREYSASIPWRGGSAICNKKEIRWKLPELSWKYLLEGNHWSSEYIILYRRSNRNRNSGIKRYTDSMYHSNS